MRLQAYSEVEVGPRLLFAALILSSVIWFATLPVAKSAAQGDSEEAVLAGKSLYYGAWGNSPYACVYCHSNFDEARLDDGYLRPGHSLWNVAARRSYYNGAYVGKDDVPLIRAINTCVAGFLKADTLPASDPKMQSLLAYLRSITPDSKAEHISITRAIKLPEIDGDPRRGEAVYASACILCHRDKGSAPALTYKASPIFVANKIRGLKAPLDAAGEIEEWCAPMPFFSMERLSDQQAADIVSYWEYKQYLIEQERLKVEAENATQVAIEEQPAENPGFEVSPPAEPEPPEELVTPEVEPK